MGCAMPKIKKKSTKQLRALERMKDSQIDTNDIPERTDWRRGAVGKFYRLAKRSRKP